MRKRIFILGAFFMCVISFAQDADVCKGEAKKVVEELNDVDYNKCILEKSSAKNKNQKIIKNRVSNRLHLNVSSRTRKRFVRYSNKRRRSVKSVVDVVGLSKGVEDASKSAEVLFAVVDELPKFIGCEENSLACFNNEFRTHFLEYFNYPEQAIKDKVEGRVFVRFIIDTDGNIGNIKTYSSGRKTVLEDEVKRILLSFPKLEAGKEKGKKANVIYSIPVDFKL